MISKQNGRVFFVLCRMRLRFLRVTSLVFLLSLILTHLGSASSDQEPVISIISEAEQAIVQAHKAVSDAEKAGADVSGLLTRLNDEASLLSEAHMASEIGQLAEALYLAELSRDVGRSIKAEAESLKVGANHARVNELIWRIASSALGVSLVLSASVLGYRRFKRCYYRRLLKMKPGVEQA